MRLHQALLRGTELDRTNFPELRDRILRIEEEGTSFEGRSYPGYPRWQLSRLHPRLWPALDKVLHERRCIRKLGTVLPSRRVLSRLLAYAHGANAPGNRGPVPSSGGLQALELYLVVLTSSWMPAGLYHYDRAGHHLSQIAAHAQRPAWQERIPSLTLIEGGVILWILVGDTTRIEAKYAERSQRFLLLEAGHMMQNLCLLSASLGCSTVPLGGYFEQEIARAFFLPDTDSILYTGVCGKVS